MSVSIPPVTGMVERLTEEQLSALVNQILATVTVANWSVSEIAVWVGKELNHAYAEIKFRDKSEVPVRFTWVPSVTSESGAISIPCWAQETMTGWHVSIYDRIVATIYAYSKEDATVSASGIFNEPGYVAYRRAWHSNGKLEPFKLSENPL